MLDMLKVTIPIIAAHRSSGPDLLLHTAEMRYNRGSSDPPYLTTRSRFSASMMKATASNRKGEDWEAAVTIRTNESADFSGLIMW